MSIDKCRICGNKFFEKPLLRYENMPKAAQYLPDADLLESDKGVQLEVCQCSGCGLVQLRNDPVSYYKDVIRAAAFSEEMKDFRTTQFADFVQKYSLEDKKIVEIGCGKGEYLSLMKQAGADVYGLEHWEESVKYCIKNEFKVSKGFVDSENYKLDNAPFSAFYILNFLEHLPDPNSTLRGIYNNLSDDAVGLIEVPNFDMIIEKNLFSEITSDHLFYFTKETLGLTLIFSGFEIVECSEVWHNYIISTIVRKRNRLDLTRFNDQQTKLKIEIDEYIERFDPQKVAIWGAGHQALAVIAMIELANKIRYVVDSAPFKQGRYTPTTHLPIVDPDALYADPVDAVIVMAASYSDEVARIIRQKFDGNINVAILRDFGLELV